MIINITKAKKSDRIMRAITGLDKNEFENLAQTFTQVLVNYEPHSTEPREREIGGGRRHTLETMEDKLFYVLFYLKCYPAFDLAALFYDVDRSQSHRWAHFLMPIFRRDLGQRISIAQAKNKKCRRIFQDIA